MTASDPVPGAVQPEKIALCLSGGGFRATMFHLGVVRELRDNGLLGRVHRIGAVSGGSILAAHLVLNWERYLGNDEDFDAAAQELVSFVRSDVRGRIIRQWILGWLTLVPRLLLPKKLKLTSLLEREYRKLFKGAKLEDLQARPGRPQVFFYSTSLSTGQVCSFGRSGFMWDEDGVEKSVVAPLTAVSFAVAASSAFPPLFPPIVINKEVLSCDETDFPNAHALTDGGVYDNLGIDRLIWYHGISPDTDVFLVSDAEGELDSDFSSGFGWVLNRNIRASDLLMKRVSTLRYAASATISGSLIRSDIDAVISRPGCALSLSPETQRNLKHVRTDLDSFSPIVIGCLIEHGQATTRQELNSRGLVSGSGTGPWTPLRDTQRDKLQVLDEVRGARKRRWRIWAWWDPWSQLTVAWLFLIACLALYPLYQQRVRVEELEIAAKNLQADSELLREIAADHFRARHRPLEPGLNAGGSTLSATICCVVRARAGGERFLLSSNGLGNKSGEAVFQPPGSGIDSEEVATVTRVEDISFPPSGVVAVLARLRDSVLAVNKVRGVGPLLATGNATLGAEVIMIGQSSGIQRARVVAEDVSIDFQGPAGPSRVEGLILLEALAGHSLPGDAGAPVVTSQGELVGMVIAGNRMGSVVVPIQRVLDLLDVELVPFASPTR